MVECLVLPGISGLAVQGLLCSCCVGVFYFKRKSEQQKLCGDGRTNEEFFLDASKQFAGAAWIHVMNLGFATVLNNLMSGGDECVWYWINIMVDTTAGTMVAYCLLRVANAAIRKRLSPTAAEDFKSGEYRGEDGIISMHKYVKQLVVWLAVVSCMKMIMVLLMFLFSGPLLAVAGFILAPFLSQPWLKLLVVMIIFPMIMDAFQIWMVDNFIKRRHMHAPEGAMQDPEMGEDYVEASANALLAFSHRCEEATEDAVLEFKVRLAEAMDEDENQDTKVKQNRVSPAGNFNTHVMPQSDGNFETQYDFQTIIPPDQAPH